jgi:mannose-1-phosphate guanylyltransferase
MNTHESNFCVIMAGGIGSRFWPMSRQHKPKQFLDILGTGKTLLQQTHERFLRIIPKENIFIVTHKSYFSLVKEQIPGITDNQILLEPTRRNTAPCVAYACSKIYAINKDAQIVVAPSDHLIMMEEVFCEQILIAFEFARANKTLVTLGIKPSRPDTGYGYIQFNSDEHIGEEKRLMRVKTFTEKPDLSLAKTFVQSGEFLWNAGIFVWSVQSIMEALRTHLPDMNQLFEDIMPYYGSAQEQALIERAYSVCQNISIDYGIMEKADNVFVLPTDFGWSDLGTWGSLYESLPKQEAGNTVIGKHVMLYDTKNCIVNMPNNKLVILQGLEDFIVVESDGILLICKKEEEQEIRQMVTNVRVQKGEEFI